jgi:hypothetical protein
MRAVKAVLIVGCAGALTAWLVAAGGPRQASAPPGRPPAPTAGTPAAAPADPFAIEVDRLRQALSRMPARGATGRDLFRFERGSDRGARPAPGARAGAAGPEEAAPSQAAVEITRPAMQLLGIAEDATGPGGSPVRTAVISSSQQLYLVKTGEQLALRFLVTAVESDGVELRDLADDSVFRLALR